MENVNLFLLGIKDSLHLPSSLITIFSNYELLKKTFNCLLINGLFYMGSIILYSYFTGRYFKEQSSDSIERDGENSEATQSTFMLLLKALLSVLYNIWIMVIYIVAVTLNTFWVQDIFDILAK